MYRTVCFIERIILPTILHCTYFKVATVHLDDHDATAPIDRSIERK